MGNKLILLLTSVLMPYILCCQEKKLVESQVFYDKTNQLPVFRISKQGEKIEVDYYTALDTINSISINVGFIGGVERLHKYCDSLYYANFSEENYNEVNVRVPYSILLDMSSEYGKFIFYKGYHYINMMKSMIMIASLKRYCFQQMDNGLKKTKRIIGIYMLVFSI